MTKYSLKYLTIVLLFILKMSTIAYSQTFEWAKSAGGINYDWVFDLTIDDSGNVYTVGSFKGTVDFDPGSDTSNFTTGVNGNAFILKLDALGNLVWVKTFGGISGAGVSSIALDSLGNIFITGDFQGTCDFDTGAGISNLTSVGNSDVFISKLDASGNFVWAKSMGGTGLDSPVKIVLDDFGNIYTLGRFKGTADFDPGIGISNLTSLGNQEDNFITKLDALGNFIWAKGIGGVSYQYSCSMAIDGLGNIYVTGEFTGTVDFEPGTDTCNLTSIGSTDIFIFKLNSLGNFVWAKTMGGTMADRGISITLDAFANVYTTGYFTGTVDFDPGSAISNLSSTIGGDIDIFISKMDSSGNFVWAKCMGGNSQDVGNSIALDASGNIYTTGQFMVTADFDPGLGTYNLSTAGSPQTAVGMPSATAAFISKLDSFGNFVWAKRISRLWISNPPIGGFSQAYGTSIFLDNSYNIYTTGQFSGPNDFDPGPDSCTLSSYGGTVDFFIHKMSQSLMNVSQSENDFFGSKLYPNPSNGKITIDLGKLYHESNLLVKNILGQELIKKQFSNQRFIEINLEGEAGIYFVTLSSPSKLAVIKVIKE